MHILTKYSRDLYPIISDTSSEQVEPVHFNSADWLIYEQSIWSRLMKQNHVEFVEFSPSFCSILWFIIEVT